jgi:uncharacterized protein (DUF488 family)
MELFTIGYTQKSARQFFELIKRHRIELLIDVRLWNSSQLAGYTKSKDLAYFLSEICRCDYVHELRYAPDTALLDGIKKGNINWTHYEVRYHKLLTERRCLEDYFSKYGKLRVCFLCAEPTADQCHRRLLAERIAALYNGTIITHI